VKKIVFLNGSGGVGKDEFVKIINNSNKFIDYRLSIRKRSTVDKVKLAAENLYWDGTKSETNRDFLSKLKLLSVAYLDHSFRYISNEINEFLTTKCNSYGNSILFVDSREPDELARFKDNFDCITVLITSNRVKHITTNMADANVYDFNYDYLIENNGSLQDLEDSASTFLSEIFK